MTDLFPGYLCDLAVLREIFRRRINRQFAARCAAVIIASILLLAWVGQVLASTTDPQITALRVGFADTYKVGYWTPLVIELAAGSEPFRGTIEAIVSDSDGIAVRIPSPQPLELQSDQAASVAMFVFPGRMDTPISAQLISEDGTTVDRLAPEATSLSAASQFILELGPTSVGLADAVASPRNFDAETNRRVIQISDPALLPAQSYGYDGVDVVLLSASDPVWINRFTARPDRLAALLKWMELGGQLIVVCGQEAQSLLVESGLLHTLAPGRFVDMVNLPLATAIESFSGSSVPLMERRDATPLAVPRFADVEGKIELFFGRQPADLPIVARIPRGFGELTFVGLDLDRQPFADWPDRPRLLRAILGISADSTEANATPAAMLTEGYADIAGALRQQLGRSFTGVTTISFAWIALLLIIYLILIGPVDYWFSHKFLRRHLIAWITFPIIVVAACCGAYWLATETKGDSLQANQAEVVDVDLATGRVRGTFWSTIYSPRHERYRLSIAPQQPTDQLLIASWGLSGAGIGGMRSELVQDSPDNAQYEISSNLDELRDMPIAMWSTKAIRADWDGQRDPPIEANLYLDSGNYLEGTIANRSGADWSGTLLLYGRSAYRIGPLRNSDAVDLSRGFDPLQLQPFLTRDMRVSLPSDTQGRTREVFFASHASLDDILKLVMFYQAAGGEAFAQLPNHYQSRSDLSSLLTLGRAILVAWVPAEAGSKLLIDGTATDPQSKDRTTALRFVIPVSPTDLRPPTASP